jgi:hypothetical protein
MTLHCAATLLVVGPEAAAEVDGAGLAASVGPWVDDVDVLAELQHLADQYRGERVLVSVSRAHLDRVVRHLGGSSAPGHERKRVRLEVGDDGWAVVPWDAE